MNLDRTGLLHKARNCFTLEIAALEATSASLDQAFCEVIGMIGNTVSQRHKLVFSGVGKNAPIAQKIVGTFNSTGVPACFLDPIQALHGDLGLCQEGDLAFLLSNNGETEDILRLIPLLKRLGVVTVGLTRRADSTLATAVDRVLTYRAESEACPLQLAPTSSTTACLVLGDALAMVYLEVRGFTREDFARYHPAGSLGQALLLRTREIMRQGERFACLPDSVSVRDALMAITTSRCGIIALTDPASGTLSGVFTDGDFRRASLHDEYVLQRPVSLFMSRHPRTVSEDSMAVEALRIFERSPVNDLIVVNPSGIPVGLIDGQDLPKLHLV